MSEGYLREIDRSQFERVARYNVTHADRGEDASELSILQPGTYYGYEGDDLQIQMAVGRITADGEVRDGETSLDVFTHGVILPEYRRTGVIRQVVPELLSQSADDGVPFVLTREFAEGVYDQFGLGRISNRAVWTCPPGALASAPKSLRGTFTRLSPDDWQALDRVHEAYRQRYSIGVARSPDYWQWILRDVRGDPYRIAGWRVDGQLRGYIVYKLQFDPPTFTEVDMGYVDTETFRHLLYYVSGHETEAKHAQFQGPETGRVYDIASAGAVSCEIRPETVLRVTDVQAALETPTYPTDDVITVAVTDRLLDRNDDTFELSVTDGVGECTPTTETEPDVETSVAALARLVAGYRPVETLCETTDLSVASESVASRLSALFPERQSFLRDDF